MVRVAVELDLFRILQSSTSPLGTSEIAPQCNANELLISRLLRMLASVGFAAETESGWSGTPVGAAMATPPLAAGMRFCFDIIGKAAVSATDYFREAGYKSPREPTDGLFTYALHTKYNAFDFMLNRAPDRLRDFNLFMGNNMSVRKFWYDWYPISESLFTGADTSAEDSVFLVDVGGGKGHDIQAFAERHPEVPGRLILQDLYIALDSIAEGSLDSRIEVQEQNFFTPNIVQGARAYFLHQILHDWSDKYALRILAQLRDAMKPGYSKLLLHEQILPNVGAAIHHTVHDIAMMAFNGGMERTRKQWTSLVEQAGLVVVSFSYGPKGDDAHGIVEVVREG